MALFNLQTFHPIILIILTKAALRRDQLRDRPDERPGGENRARQVIITTF